MRSGGKTTFRTCEYSGLVWFTQLELTTTQICRLKPTKFTGQEGGLAPALR